MLGFQIAFLAAFLNAGLGQVASASAASAEAACQDLHAAICGTGDSVFHDREQRIQSRLDQVIRDAMPELIEAGIQFDLRISDPSDPLRSMLQSTSIRYPYEMNMAKRAVAALYAPIERRLMARLGMLDLERARNALIAALDDLPNLDAKLRDEMRSRIRLTRLLLPSEYLATDDLTRDEVWPLLSQVRADTAWNLAEADPESQSSRVIIVFPGLLAAQDRPGNLTFVLAHELAHSIDFEIMPSLYKNLQTCLNRRMGAPDNQMAEISADAWGLKALEHELRSSRLSPEETLKSLVASHEILCGSESEENSIASISSNYVHPDGKFRINVLLGENAGIRELLQCSPLPQTESCGL